MIEKAIEDIEEALKAKSPSEEDVEKASRSLDLDIPNFCQYQALRGWGVEKKCITQEDAAIMLKYMGNIPSYFNNQPLQVKVVLTKVFVILTMRREKWQSFSKVKPQEQ